MTDRFNTIAGWVLFSGIVALGLSILSGMYFEADRPHAPHTAGYPIEGAEEEGGGDQGPSLALALSQADVAAGQAVFAKCQACHTTDQGGAHGIGPNLYGIMGQPIGQHAPGFAYSDALASKGGTWTFEAMDEWLASPRAFAAGTKMSFAGLSSIEDRAAVILYLNSLGSGLPLPTPEEPAAAEGEAATEATETAPVPDGAPTVDTAPGAESTAATAN